MWNPVSTGANTYVNTSASLVLGFGAGMTAPPQMLVQNLSASGSVTLPKIDSVLPSAPGTPGTAPGIGDGYLLIIKSIAQYTTTITPASGDTCDVSYVTNVGDVVLLQVDAQNSKWRAVAPITTNTNQYVSVAAASTLAATTRYLLVTAASTQTINTTIEPTFQPFTIINESSGSLTITPSSGNIDTTASITLGTLKSTTLLFDGVNTHCLNTA
jgi:hypothetical protein